MIGKDWKGLERIQSFRMDSTTLITIEKRMPELLKAQNCLNLIVQHMSMV